MLRFGRLYPRPNRKVNWCESVVNNFEPYAALTFPSCSNSTIYFPIFQYVSVITLFTFSAISFLAFETAVSISSTNGWSIFVCSKSFIIYPFRICQTVSDKFNFHFYVLRCLHFSLAFSKSLYHYISLELILYFIFA